MRLGLRRIPLRSSINVTPLVDVVLVLLIVFLLVAPLLDAQLGVALPTNERATEEAVPEDAQIVIDLTREGEGLLDGRVMDDEELRSALRERLRYRPERIVFFRGDPLARYGRWR